MSDKILLDVLQGKKVDRTPVWLMRQAGRYLAEYMAIRQECGSFLDLVYNPEKAAEVTIQPVRRFGMDGAILFSDILVIPQALGQGLKFVQGEGPKLDALQDDHDISKLDVNCIDEVLSPIYETVSRVRSGLDDEGFGSTTLIGFAGAPWTIACYMIEGGGSKDFYRVKKWAYANPGSFSVLIDKIVEATIHYLCKQIDAGAEVVKLFDSHAGVLDSHHFGIWAVEPVAKIVKQLKEKYTEVPVIGFPRGAGALYEGYADQTGVDGLALDQGVNLLWAEQYLMKDNVVLQGNLDPMRLLVGGESLRMGVEDIMAHLSRGRFIFNLGHGIIKETPPEHVEELVRYVRVG